MATVNTLVIGGGGGGGTGGSGSGGGGGAGGYQTNAALTVTAQAYTITIGAGGGSATVGQNSSFNGITANGGGFGATANTSTIGGNGGSGGGGGSNGSSANTGGTGNQGSNGGGSNGNSVAGGGGGGASVAGSQGGAVNGVNGGAGGIGTANSISGASVTYAGGGGGGSQSDLGGAGGGGGGGKGGSGSPSSVGVAGTANTGGGGGGGAPFESGLSGGSGVVIISYKTDGSDGIRTTSTGGTITTSGANTIHTFTTSGTFTASLPPTVTTQAVTSILATTATGNGNITDISGNNVTLRGFVYDTVSKALPGNVAPGASGYSSNVSSAGSFGTGAYINFISGLTTNTTYYVRSFVQNSAGYSYGAEVSFLTPTLPILTTQAATLISPTTATGNGNITNTGRENNDIRGVVYDTVSKALPGNVAPASSGYASKIEESGGSFGTGAFTEVITPLIISTTYYVRAYSHNSVGYSYGNEINLATIAYGNSNFFW